MDLGVSVVKYKDFIYKVARNDPWNPYQAQISNFLHHPTRP